MEDKSNILYLAKKYGTPIFLIDLNKIIENLQRFRNAFKKEQNIIIGYSIKTNYYSEILKKLFEQKVYPEVICDIDYEFSKRSGGDLSKVIFNGPAKTEEELEKAIKNNAFLIIVDSETELDKIEKIALKLDKEVDIGIRINPKIDFKSPFIGNTKLGIKKKYAKKLIENLRNYKHINLKALHVNIGTQIIDIKAHAQALQYLLNFSRELKNDLNINIKYIDLGGGYASETTLNENGLSITDFANEIHKIMKQNNSNQTLIFELGRYIVEDACYVISKVISIKEQNDKWVLLDISANYLVPLSTANYKVELVDKSVKTEVYNFGGRICYSADIIQKRVKFPKLKEGDIVLVRNTGAYTWSWSANYGDLLPPIIIKENNNYRLTKKRQTLQQVYRSKCV